MKRKIVLSILLVISSACIISAQTFQSPKIRQQARPLAILKWLKGEPVPKFREGHIYVVEFSATWCPPCLKAIPHLTELAREYFGKVTIISVYTQECKENTPISNRNIIEKVSQLIKNMGTEMEYTVGVDIPPQITGDQWGVKGVPIAFVINQSGEIAWSGDPMNLASVLKQIVKGNFGSEIAIQQDLYFKNCVDRIIKFKAEGNYLTALKLLDSLIDVHHTNPGLYRLKFRILAGANDQAANTFLNWILNNPIEGFDWTHFIHDSYSFPEKPDFELAIAVADRAFSEAETKEMTIALFQQKANIYLKKATIVHSNNEMDLCNAVKIYKQAVVYCKSFGDSTHMKEYEDRMYRLQYRIFAVTDNKKADELLRWILNSKIDYITWGSLINDVIELPKKPNYNLALELADYAVNTTKDGNKIPARLAKKGDVYAAMGDKVKAADLYQQAIDYSLSAKNIKAYEYYQDKMRRFQTHKE